MENNNSYADSGDSSPRSRDIDCENPSCWDDQPPSNYRVKFMCSYGGKIQPRPHDNQLTYTGGDTKIFAVDRNIKFADIMNKLSSLCDSDIIFKYQLPGEDLDALISVTNDEDLEHMMSEYDRVHRISPKPQKLRLFLFKTQKNFDSTDSKPNQKWLADSLNSVPIQSLDSSLVEVEALPQNTQDFLFGFDKTGVNIVNIVPPVPKLPESETFYSDVSVRSDSVVDESVVSPTISQVEIQRQIHELQKLQIASQANQEQAMFRKNSDEALARAFHGDYYVHNVADKTVSVPVPVGTPIPGTVTSPQAYWQDRNGGGGYTTGPVTGNEQHPPVYLIQSPAGMYQTSAGAVQPVTGVPQPTGMYQTSAGNLQPVTGQGYYAMQRGGPEVYREQPVFSIGPPPPQLIARPGAGVGGGMAMTETGYTQVAYDGAGRQVYYTAAPGSVMPAAYQTVVGTGGMDLRQVAPLNANPEGKVATTAGV